jgi:hypothetical protein
MRTPDQIEAEIAALETKNTTLQQMVRTQAKGAAEATYYYTDKIAALEAQCEALAGALRKIDRMNDHPEWFRKALNDILEAALAKHKGDA